MIKVSAFFLFLLAGSAQTPVPHLGVDDPSFIAKFSWKLEVLATVTEAVV